MGSNIKITNKGIITITGVKKLNKANHKILSDRIVAGTFAIAAVMLNKKFAIDRGGFLARDGLTIVYWMEFESELAYKKWYEAYKKLPTIFCTLSDLPMV